MKNRKPPSTDLFPSSLLAESQRVLGEEFSRLPKRIQTGYTLVFWNHSGLIRHNTHNRRPDSFPMDTKERARYFTDPRNFNAVNDNGYYLRLKSTGEYALRRKDEEGAIFHQPTNWLIKTIEAFVGWKKVGVTGSKNGYQLTPKIQGLVDDWFEKPRGALIEPIGLVNRNGDSASKIAKHFGGAICRDKSKTSKNVNINALIKVDTESLKLHKEQLTYTLRKLEEYKAEELPEGTKEWLELLGKLQVEEGKEREGKTGGKNLQTLGGVKVINILSKPLESLASKDFERDGVKSRILEINKLLATTREENSSTIPIFYDEVRTGRYTAKNGVIQGYHKSVRYAALKGCYEYDLEAAHQNILVQLLDSKKIDFPELEVLREYIKDKKNIRQQLAKELTTSVDIVKQIIQALTYGAQLSRSKKRALYDICEGNMELVERAIINPWLEKLAKTFLIAHKHLIGDKKILKNAVGIKSELLSGKAQLMAHMLQGYERLVLDVLIEHSKPEDVALLVHDCIVYYTPKNTTDLSRIIYEETGFNLAFSEEPY